MKCVQCKEELGLKRKLISCDGDFVCDDKCHDNFHKDMDKVCAMTDAQFYVWMGQPLPEPPEITNG